MIGNVVFRADHEWVKLPCLIVIPLEAEEAEKVHEVGE
jgi:hypothetical protein